MICPTCKSYKFENEKFCSQCGTKTVEFHCTCGRSLALTQQFCPGCGAKCPKFEPQPETVAAD